MSAPVAAYDYDGVLAEGPPPPPRPWRHLTGAQRQAHRAGLALHYASAQPLYSPSHATFHVITARRDTPELRAVSQAWLDRHLPGRVTQLWMLNTARTIEAVLDFKGSLLRQLGVVHYHEDNPKVVAGLRRLGLPTHIWLYRRGVMSCG